MAHPTYRQTREILNTPAVCPSDAEWRWDPLEATVHVRVADNMLDVTVHPYTSRGTGGMRGDTAFVPGQMYYWEIEVNGSHTATDTIIGVGTKDFDLKSSEDEYCSLIGSDKKSWGYSYTGVKHHDGETLPYGLRFEKRNTLVGVRLDMWRGTLEFFLNRNPLGIAYSNLNVQQDLYPMVCSTACQTKFKVKYCRSLPVNLQLLCLQALDSSFDSKIPHGLMKDVMDSWWIPKKCSS